MRWGRLRLVRGLAAFLLVALAGGLLTWRTGLLAGLVLPTSRAVAQSEPSAKTVGSATPAADAPPSIEVETVQREQAGASPFAYTVRYPRLIGGGLRNIGFNQTMERWVQDEIGGFLAQVPQSVVPNAPTGLRPQLICNVAETYLDVRLASARVDCAIALGGGHGAATPRTQTWDLHLGQQVRLADLFLPYAPYPRVLSNACYQLLGQQLNGSFRPPWFNRPPRADDFPAFVVTPKGLELVFGQYEVAPGSAGEPAATVPYATLANFIPEDGLLAHAAKAGLGPPD